MRSRPARVVLAVVATAASLLLVPAAVSSAGTTGDGRPAKPTKSEASPTPSPAPTTSPQPKSNADRNPGGANNDSDCGAYCSTRDGSDSRNGNDDADPQPCAGCEGRADNKYPPGQNRDGADHNNGYECDGNKGIAKTNPAHTGCQAPATEPTTPPCVPTEANPCGAPCVPSDANPCEPCVPSDANPCEPPCVPTEANPCGAPCVPSDANPCAPCVPSDANPCEPPCVPSEANPCTPPCIPTDENPCTPCVPTEEDPCVPPVVCPPGQDECAPVATPSVDAGGEQSPAPAPAVRGVRIVNPRGPLPGGPNGPAAVAGTRTGVAAGQLPTTGATVSVLLLLLAGFGLVAAGVAATVSGTRHPARS
ncbi:MAG TPA: hypothetical protein VNA14_11635 [Mycobacteriales bacterium]|nr:hypothetical protein [Mycobacteriales bacterium]